MRYYNQCCAVGAAVFMLMQSANVVAQQSWFVIGAESFARDCYERSQNSAISGSGSRLDIEVCDRAISDGAMISSKLAATYANRGVIFMALEDLSSAYKDYEKVLEIDPTLAEAYINRGNLWFAVQQFERAIADYDSALDYGTNKGAITLLNRGLARENSGDLIGAKSDYLASIEVKPGWQPVLDKLARVNSKLNKQNND